MKEILRKGKIGNLFQDQIRHAKDNNIANTIVSAINVGIQENSLNGLYHDLRLPIGTAETPNQRRFHDEHPVVSLADGALAALVEEPIFRTLPQAFSKSDISGILLSALFAVAHNIRPDKKLETSKIPIPQFFLGKYLWEIHRRKGLLHAIVAHAVYNTTVEAFHQLRNFRKK